MFNGQVTEANAVQKLGELAEVVREDLVVAGLIRPEDNLPTIALLEAVMALGRSDEGARTRFLAMMRDWAFTVTTSREYRVFWNRQPYTFGPIPVQVTLGPATKLIESVVARNSRIYGYERNPAFKSDPNAVPDEPVMIHWAQFVYLRGEDSEGGKEWGLSDESTQESVIAAGPTYAALAERHKGTLQRRARNVAQNPASVLEAKNAARHVAAAGQYAGNYPPGVNYRDISGTVTDGFSPRQPVPPMPASVQGAILGPQPTGAVQHMRTPAPVVPTSGGAKEGTQFPPPPPPKE